MKLVSNFLLTRDMNPECYNATGGACSKVVPWNYKIRILFISLLKLV